MGQISLWSFLERIGEGLGIGERAITSTLAAGGLISLLGPLLAGLLGYRSRWFLILGLLGTATSVSLFRLPEPLIAFVAGDFVFNLLGQFCIVYFLTTLTQLDPSGRLVSSSPAFMSLGIALGPLAGGFAIELGSSALFATAAGLHAVAALMLLPGRE